MTADAAAVVRDYWRRVFLERDLDAVVDLATDPSIRHTPDGVRTFAHEELKAYLRDALHAFRTEAIDFEAMSVDGDDVWMRASIRAVSLATMMPITMAWIAQYRIEGGRIAEAWTLHRHGSDWR